MYTFQQNNFDSCILPQKQSLQLIDVFTTSGHKTLTLQAHTSLLYLVVCRDAHITLTIDTAWPECSCIVFGLFASRDLHDVASRLTVDLQHSHTTADVQLVSFLYDWARADIDGSIIIGSHISQARGRLLEQNIVLGKNVSFRTLPQLLISSHDVSATHGASIDTLDAQKLFYMMSRGLDIQTSQQLLVDWYIQQALHQFPDLDPQDRQVLYRCLS